MVFALLVMLKLSEKMCFCACNTEFPNLQYMIFIRMKISYSCSKSSFCLVHCRQNDWKSCSMTVV